MYSLHFIAVRAGDLSRFKEVLETFAERFQQEKTWSLIIRLAIVIFIKKNNFLCFYFHIRLDYDIMLLKQALK